jgi:glucosamine 6-phosphate synthetase-like amidotransferase/phosphosugar isomerase protein
LCGIIGFCGDVPEGRWKETYRILEAMFLAAEDRGTDATGYAAITKPFDSGEKGFVTAKEPIRASQFVESDTWRSLANRRCLALIGHVRWKTHGDAANEENNHPHIGQNNLALVHNGILSNHLEVASTRRLSLISQCDSEVLIRLVEKYANPIYGLNACLKECCGSMAIAVLDPKKGMIHLARNTHRSLWLARLKNDRRWWFASTAAILVDALVQALGKEGVANLDQLFPIASNVVHTLMPSGLLLADCSAVELA